MGDGERPLPVVRVADTLPDGTTGSRLALNAAGVLLAMIATAALLVSAGRGGLVDQAGLTPTGLVTSGHDPACQAQDLLVRRSTDDVLREGNTELIRVLVTNNGSTPCQLSGPPRIPTGVRADGRTVPLDPDRGTLFDTQAIPAGLLPFQTAAVDIETSTGCPLTAPPDPLVAVSLELPGGEAEIDGPFDDRCSFAISSDYVAVTTSLASPDGWTGIAP